jgi:hypothetical protein
VSSGSGDGKEKSNFDFFCGSSMGNRVNMP